MGIENILQTILALIIIIWLANLALSKLNTYMHGQNQSIQIIERYSLSKHSSLAIVKVLNQYYLMSLSEGHSEILKELTEKEIEMISDQIAIQKDSSPTDLIASFDYAKWQEKYQNFLKKKEDK